MPTPGKPDTLAMQVATPGDRATPPVVSIAACECFLPILPVLEDSIKQVNSYR